MLHLHNYSRLALRSHQVEGPIRFADKEWKAISLSDNFAEITSPYFVLLSSIKGIERLFVDCNSKGINALFEKICELSSFKTNFDILKLVSQTIDDYTMLHPSVAGEVRETIDQGLDTRIDEYLVQRKFGLIKGKPANLDIPIDELMEAGLLNCSHKGLLATVIIGKLIQKKILPFGSSRFYRTLIHVKGSGYNAGHAWAVYNHFRANAIWVIDPRWENVQKVDRTKPLKLGYGKYPAREMIKRIEKLDNLTMTKPPSVNDATSSPMVDNASAAAEISTAHSDCSSDELAAILLKLYRYYGQQYYMLDMQYSIDMTCKSMARNNQDSFLHTLVYLNIPYEIDFEILRVRIEKADFNRHYDAICSAIQDIGALQRKFSKKIEQAKSIKSLIRIISSFSGYIQADDGNFINVGELTKAIVDKSNGIDDKSNIALPHQYGLAQKVDMLIQQLHTEKAALQATTSINRLSALPQTEQKAKPVEVEEKQQFKAKR